MKKDISIVTLFLVSATLLGVLFRECGFHETNVEKSQEICKRFVRLCKL